MTDLNNTKKENLSELLLIAKEMKHNYFKEYNYNDCYLEMVIKILKAFDRDLLYEVDEKKLSILLHDTIFYFFKNSKKKNSFQEQLASLENDYLFDFNVN